jgi:hypothetical protein
MIVICRWDLYINFPLKEKKSVYKFNNWTHSFNCSKCALYLLGSVLPPFFEVEALCEDATRRNGIPKSSESLNMRCSVCWCALPLKCLCMQGPFLVVKKQDTFSQPLESKIRTSKEQLLLHVKITRSFSWSSCALAKSSHPDLKSSSSAFFVTLTSHVSPLGAFRLNTLVICPFRLLTNFSGML